MGAGLELRVGDAKNPRGLAGTQRGHEEVGGLTSPTYLHGWHPPGTLGRSWPMAARSCGPYVATCSWLIGSLHTTESQPRSSSLRRPLACIS